MKKREINPKCGIFCKKHNLDCSRVIVIFLKENSSRLKRSKRHDNKMQSWILKKKKKICGIVLTLGSFMPKHLWLKSCGICSLFPNDITEREDNCGKMLKTGESNWRVQVLVLYKYIF